MKFVLENVSFGYSDEVDALKGVSADFESGEFTGILGPNGSGKTTLIKLLSGELSPAAGRCLLDGEDIGRMRAKQRARRIAVVPQKSDLAFHFTVIDVVLMGRYAHIRRFRGESLADYEAAEWALETVGLRQMKNRPATELSGGEWQRVLIARAFCQSAPVLILDEPVANLDIRHQVDTMRSIKAMAHERGAMALCVMHDINLAAHYCDRFLLLSEGRLLADGRPEEVLTRENMRIAYQIEADIKKDAYGVTTISPSYDRYGGIFTL